METNFYEAVTLYQKAEALECAIAALERWNDLQPFSDPLKKEYERIVREAARYGKMP